MSQAGAKHAAKLGIGYAAILAFYYPGTQVVPAYAKEGISGMTSQDLINEFQ